MKILSLFAVFVVLFAMVFFAVPAYADFDVLVDSEGKFIVTPLHSIGSVDTLYFADGVADFKNYTSEGGGIFYAIGEGFVERLKADGYTIYGREPDGAIPSIGSIYFVMAGIHEGGRIAWVFPVEFSPFGIGLHSYEGGTHHGGTVYLNPESASNLEKRENLW